MKHQRVKLQPAWVLHRRDFRDSSQIVDILTPEHGRLSVVARGIKRPKNRHRGLLQPFSPLLVSWAGKSELVTLSDVERGTGDSAALAGEHLLSGFYLNELMLRLTQRYDPQPELFSLYGTTIDALAGAAQPAVALREFELDLLRILGFGLNLTRDAQSGAQIDADGEYTFAIDQGPIRCAAVHEQEATIRGSLLLAMAARDWSLAETKSQARHILARAIDWQLDGKPLQTRRVLRHMRRSAGSPTNNTQAEE